MKALSCLAAIAAAVALSRAAAQELPTQWGVHASTHYADCFTFAISCNQFTFGLGLWPIQDGPETTGFNQTTASQLDVDLGYFDFTAGFPIDAGTAGAEAELDLSNAGAPILRAAASAEDGFSWVSGFAFAVAGYDYLGPPGTIDLEAALTGTVRNPGANDVSGLSVAIWVVRDDGSVPFPTPAPSTLGELFTDFVALLPVEDGWEPADLRAPGDMGGGSCTLAADPDAVCSSTGSDPVSVTFSAGDIAAGDTRFYVVAGLVAAASGTGTSAESLSTLTLDFVDSSALVSAAPLMTAAVRSHPIPLPATALALLAAALAGIAARRGRTG